MRHTLVIVALLALFGCGNDDAPADKPNNPEPDSSTPGPDSSVPKPDSGSPDAGPPATDSRLERPGLERPPTRLPDDLRPPRD